MLLLQVIEGFFSLITTLAPVLLDFGIQLWNVKSVNDIFEENNCVLPQNYQNLNLSCEGNSKHASCELECLNGFVPSIKGSASQCSFGFVPLCTEARKLGNSLASWSWTVSFRALKYSIYTSSG